MIRWCNLVGKPSSALLRPALWVAATMLGACGADAAQGAAAAETDAEAGGSGGADSAGSHGGSGTAGGQCVDDGDCWGEAPLCRGGLCIPCDAVLDGDAGCADKDPDAPVCDAGQCVQCTADAAGACGDDRPVCSEDQRCVPCQSHEQCDLACDLASGACFDKLVVVDAAGGGDYEDLASAFASIRAEDRLAIRVVPQDGCYVGTLSVPPSARIALLGAEDQPACLTSVAATAVLAMPEGGALFMSRLRIDNAVGPALEGEGAVVFIDRSEIVNNQGGGLLFSQASTLVVRNSFVGGDRNHVPAIWVRDSDLEVSYSTLAAGFGDAVALDCVGDGDVDVRNSILVAESSGGEVSCSNAVIRRSALESAFGTGNVAVGAVDTRAWFVDFSGGDLHLDPEAATMFANVARWDPGDPLVDLDGDPRPTLDAQTQQDWAGADIPPAP